jgi:membrane protein required for colicin V production
MNWLDVAFVAIIALSVIGGFFRGLARELLGLFGLGAGFFVALTLSGGLAPLLEKWLIRPAAYAVVFLALFLVTMVVADLLGNFITVVIKKVKLSTANQVAGGVFGLARGVLLVVVLFTGLLMATDDEERLTAGSRLAPWAVKGSRLVLSWLPDREIRNVDSPPGGGAGQSL